jgi:hypothetical protein
MESEGQGRRPPVPVLVDVTPSEIEMCIDFAREYIERCRYAGRPGWKGGLVRSLKLPCGRVLGRDIAGTVLGKVGECAMCKLSGVALDVALRLGGDGGSDLPLPCGSVQVKTTQRDYDSRFVRIPAERADWFVFAHWSGSGYLVSIDGYLSRAVVCRSETVGSSSGAWTNYSVSTSRFHPIRSLLRIRPVSEVL